MSLPDGPVFQLLDDIREQMRKPGYYPPDMPPEKRAYLEALIAAAEVSASELSWAEQQQTLDDLHTRLSRQLRPH